MSHTKLLGGSVATATEAKRGNFPACLQLFFRRISCYQTFKHQVTDGVYATNPYFITSEVSLEVVGKATITGKFQVTLPKSVREFLKTENGDFLVFVKDRDAITVKRGRVKIED